MKHCNKCDTDKPVEEFGKNRAAKDGLNRSCKSCIRKRDSEYYKNNRKKVLEQKREYYKDNREQKLESKSKYYKDNLEKRRKYLEDNREKVAERNRKWKKENPEKIRAYKANRRARKQGVLTEIDIQTSAAYRIAINNDPCFYCGTAKAKEYQVDHYFPIAKGGDDRWYNLVRACQPCNGSKHAKCGTYFMLMKGFK